MAKRKETYTPLTPAELITVKSDLTEWYKKTNSTPRDLNNSCTCINFVAKEVDRPAIDVHKELHNNRLKRRPKPHFGQLRPKG